MRLLLLVGALAATDVGFAAGLETVGSAYPDAPHAVIVHGIDPVVGELQPLANDLIARGFHTHIFHYSSHERLEISTEALANEIHELAARPGTERVVVVGYSLGGLVARRALTHEQGSRLEELPVAFELVTIASPLGGFRSANLWWLGLGFARPLFRDLGTQSRFIDEPGTLVNNARHTKVETVEKGAIRLADDRWLDDDVVGLKSQVHDIVDAQTENIYRIELGHTQIVNAYGNVHPKLVAILDAMLAERPSDPALVSDAVATSQPYRLPSSTFASAG